VGFTSSKSSGETVRRVLITLERGSMEEIEAMYTSLQAVLMGKRQEVKGRELTDFHRSIIERRLSSVEEKYRQLKLIK